MSSLIGREVPIWKYINSQYHARKRCLCLYWCDPTQCNSFPWDGVFFSQCVVSQQALYFLKHSIHLLLQTWQCLCVWTNLLFRSLNPTPQFSRSWAYIISAVRNVCGLLDELELLGVGGGQRLLIGYPAYLHQTSFCQLDNKLFRPIYMCVCVCVCVCVCRKEWPRKVIWNSSLNFFLSLLHRACCFHYFFNIPTHSPFFVTLRPNAGHGLLIIEVSRSHTTTHHSSGRVISSSQRPLPDNTHRSQHLNIHVPGGIRTHDLSRRAAVDLRLRSRGHWDRLMHLLYTL